MQVSSATNPSAYLPNTNSNATSDPTGFQSMLDDYVALDPSDATLGTDQGAGGATTDPAQAFLNYMKETPAQRLEDAWLASHHMTRKDLETMSPEQRAAIEKQMAADIKEQLKEQTEKKSGGTVDLLA